jgi:uncharacterized membrane protein
LIQDPNSSTWLVPTTKTLSPLSRIQANIVANLTVPQKHTALVIRTLASNWKTSFLPYLSPSTLPSTLFLLMATWLKTTKGQSVRLWLVISASCKISTFLAILLSETSTRHSTSRKCRSVLPRMQTVRSHTSLSSLGTGF